MKKSEWSLLLLICGAAAFCEQSQPTRLQRVVPPQGMCEAASSKLRETATDSVILTMVVDASGRVQSFTTDSPKGLRLEKMKGPADAIKAMRFEPAKKDGRPVAVMIKVEFDCAGSATHIASPHE